MKKILLIIAIVLCIFQMVVLAIDIDIGAPAINRDYNTGINFTYVEGSNAANANGKITSVKIWANSTLGDCKVATFYVVSGNNLSTRDEAAIGTVTAGAERTFIVDIDVQTGDYIGVSYTTGGLEVDLTGGTGYWSLGGDQIPCIDTTFNYSAERILSLGGTGTTDVGWDHKWNTKTISKWNTKEFTKWNALE